MPSLVANEATREATGGGRMWRRRPPASVASNEVWLAVLFDAVFGPDIVSSSTRVPSAIVVALFAYLATRVVARYGFGQLRRDTDRGS
jgi:hypothetical protein